MSQCVDPIVGKILAGWRYDISGLAPEMGGDYEEHFTTCEHCRRRQRLHRTIDRSQDSDRSSGMQWNRRFRSGRACR